MAIFGINLSDFGSRKLRFDSQKANNVSFNGVFDDGVPNTCAKYAVPEHMRKEYKELLNDAAPMMKYAIPSENFLPYVNIKPPIPKKPQNPKDNSDVNIPQGLMKYAIPKK